MAFACLAAACTNTDGGEATPPRRVVSMNLCTDLLAMLVAAPGQLHSVSNLASDPVSSVLAEEAHLYAVNHGLAEEIFLMQPDLVLTGTYTTKGTADLLKGLGIRVEEFAPETSFDDIRANLRRMGDLLGRHDRAEELVADLDRRLAALASEGRRNMTVAPYYANSYTAGGGTLVDAIVASAGLTNIAAELGYVGTGRLPLEVLVLADPDLLLIGDRDYSGPALAQQGFEHPAFRAQTQRSATIDIASRYTICGTPFTAEAAHLLAKAAEARQGATE